MHIDLTTLTPLVQDHYLTCRTHPTLPLRIYNYTFKTQVTRHWTPQTRMCRGLITTHEGEVVAYPLKKFFNWEEHQEWGDIPDEPFTVTTKEDGSLLIVTRYQGELVVATRGSFTSEQALRGRKIIQEKYPDFDFLPSYTYLYEVVYKDNRVVVDYGEFEDIILLAVIKTETGEEQDIHTPLWRDIWPFPVVKRYDGIKDIGELLAMEEENQEGFVLRFQSGLRVKCKFSEYVRIHRIITQTTARDIWEHLKEGKSLKPMLEKVPQAFEAWVKQQSRDISSRYRQRYQQSRAVYKQVLSEVAIANGLSFHMQVSHFLVDKLANEMRNHVKERFQEYPELAPFLLMLYARKRDKEVSDAIWDSLYPPPTRPFRIEEDAV